VEDDETNDQGALNVTGANVSQQHTPSKSKNRSSNLSAAMHESRKMFSNSLEAIMQVLASLDLHSGGPANPVNQTAKECNDFKNYVKSQLYLKNAKDKLNDAALSGLMTPEDYYELRVLPLLEEIEKQEGKLRLATRLLQISSMISSSIAVVLGSAGVTIFIPVAIAAATGLFQFLKVNDYERRFEIASSAARELRALNSHWESLSDLDHQMRGSIAGAPIHDNQRHPSRKGRGRDGERPRSAATTLHAHRLWAEQRLANLSSWNNHSLDPFGVDFSLLFHIILHSTQ